ncbi:MAG: HDOD domain-containing protein, partial [Fimbriimonas ginsengisoli]|nr:HDOD domain-containing protein [Fimbriimonas ginsengisoli]
MTLEAILKQTTDLPTFPAAALAVLKETSSADASANSISKHITQDQALTARVLRLANSAYYGLPRQVMDVSESVIVLGTRTVRNLCMVAATYPWMSRPLPGYGLEPYHLWVNSFSVALGSKLIAERTGAAQSDSAFTAGLLHNIGKVALSAWLENKLGSVQQIAQAEGLSFDEVERRMFGFDHAEVGAFLAERWNLPKP